MNPKRKKQATIKFPITKSSNKNTMNYPESFFNHFASMRANIASGPVSSYNQQLARSISWIPYSKNKQISAFYPITQNKKKFIKLS